MPGHMFTLVDYCQLVVRQMLLDGVPGNVGSMFSVLEDTMKELKDELNSHDSAVRREADGIAASKKLKKKRKLAADKKAGKLDRLAPFSPRPPVFPPPMHSLLDNGYAFEQAVHIHREHRERLESRLAPPPEPAPSTIAAPSQPAWSGERPKAARNIGLTTATLVDYCQLVVRQMREDGVPANVGSMFSVLEYTMKELKELVEKFKNQLCSF